MDYTLRFADLLEYDAGKEGITVPVTLHLGDTFVGVEAKTATGSFLTYGHGVTLSVRKFDFDIIAYFAADEWITRNVLGRHGWLNRVRMGLLDYEGQLYVSRADDEN